jgi:hypothetical protein
MISNQSEDNSSMVFNYCTLFDSFYLSRGLCLYHSLKATTPNFRLYIFPFDKQSDRLLRDLDLPEVVIVSQAEFETPQLLQIKSERTRGEYCWTTTPVIIEYCIKTYQLSICTYLDADLFFFSNANQLVELMGDKSIMITDHRYTPRYDQSKTSGKYCVQFMTFKNDKRGLTALHWWRDRCLEWCYDRIEDGKFGDQKYLDDWTTRFEGVYELQHEGGGLAPWNIQQYQVQANHKPLSIKNRTKATEWPVVFYHFHALRFLATDKIDLSTYALKPDIINFIYRPYVQTLAEWNDRLLQHGIKFPVQNYATKKRIPVALHKLIRRLLGVYSIFSLDKLRIKA